MNRSLTVALMFASFFANAQSSNCSPTFSEIFDFEIGDVFLYGIKENPGGGTQDYWYSKETVTILDKIISGDTISYYRQKSNANGIDLDTLVLVDDSSQVLNKCDSTLVPINSFLHYKGHFPGSVIIYAYLRVYDNDTIRTWENDYPRLVKAIRGGGQNELYYLKTDSGTFIPYDEQVLKLGMTLEFASGAGLVYEGHGLFESVWTKRLIYKINGTDTTIYHTASIPNSNLKPLHFSVFPNPVKDKLTINYETLSASKYTILNTLGQSVANGESSSMEQTIDLSYLSAGVYFLKTSRQDASGTVRFIKE
jgi:hypothetical protein